MGTLVQEAWRLHRLYARQDALRAKAREVQKLVDELEDSLGTVLFPFQRVTAREVEFAWAPTSRTATSWSTVVKESKTILDSAAAAVIDSRTALNTKVSTKYHLEVYDPKKHTQPALPRVA